MVACAVFANRRLAQRVVPRGILPAALEGDRWWDDKTFLPPFWKRERADMPRVSTCSISYVSGLSHLHHISPRQAVLPTCSSTFCDLPLGKVHFFSAKLNSVRKCEAAITGRPRQFIGKRRSKDQAFKDFQIYAILPPTAAPGASSDVENGKHK